MKIYNKQRDLRCILHAGVAQRSVISILTESHDFSLTVLRRWNALAKIARDKITLPMYLTSRRPRKMCRCIAEVCGVSALSRARVSAVRCIHVHRAHQDALGARQTPHLQIHIPTRYKTRATMTLNLEARGRVKDATSAHEYCMRGFMVSLTFISTYTVLTNSRQFAQDSSTYAIQFLDNAVRNYAEKHRASFPVVPFVTERRDWSLEIFQNFYGTDAARDCRLISRGS